MTEAAETVEKLQICVKEIPKDTKKEVLEEHFKQFDGEVVKYVENAKNPYAFVDVPKEKFDEALEAELKIGEKVCNVAKKYPLIKYFIETTSTDGDLNKIDADKLKAYFETKGKVVSLEVKEGKQIGFLSMVKGLDDEAADLAWHTHTIEEQTVNVKENQEKRGRKRRGGFRGRGRGKRRRGRGRGKRF